MRGLALGLLALAALGGCVATTTSYPSPAITAPIASEPSGPNRYSAAARAALQSELFACSGYGSNIGQIGSRGEALAYSPYIYTPAGPLLRNPTETACLSSGFGWRGLADGGERQHNGLDLANPSGGYVYAAADGQVTFANRRGGYGISLEIDHGNGVRTFYAHLSDVDPNLSPGAFVSAGQPVARMGRTGNATGVHLHYEVSIDGLTVDPLHYGPPPEAAPIM
ncbi:MAG TPA: M23 family metallopeptidase [Vitreimonas sp.]|uniref:M23 family metallopeptidase n=1 Tax=Vitreimonas sp. TaxID=3069702 RepID=UPI002D62551B|nr:M23 family metallopeptidase [Vitreimonas sp.]HYD87293.1 M23 family metallopeptidase [Vitreimonas sp.]